MISGLEISRLITKGDITIEPFVTDQINPNSYNLTIGDTVIVYDPIDGIIDSHFTERNRPKELLIPLEGLVLEPSKIYLTNTIETIGSDKYTFMIATRSSMGRIGMNTVLGNFGDVGYHGHITLQLSCVQPVRIYPNTCISQIYWESIEGDISLYHGRYNDNDNGTSKGV